MTWPEATVQIVELVCGAAMVIAVIAGFLGIEINVHLWWKDKK